MAADLRHALTSIARMPGLAAVVIGSLGAGIGANGVVFSWVQAVVFTPIVGVEAGADLHLIEPKTDAGLYAGASWPDYRDLREQTRAMDRLFAFRMIPLYVGERGRVERSSGLIVSDNYFTALGLAPALGRFFRPDEVERPGGAPVAVISYDYWQTRFVGSPDAAGRTLRVNGAELTIVGVAPRGFKGTIMRLTFDLWAPATLAPVLIAGSRELDDRAIRGYTIAGYLADGAGIERAQADVESVMRRLGETYPQTNRTLTGEVLPFWRSPRGPQRSLAAALAIMQAIMLALLLAVCGNTANLLLARASARQREVSVRIALGAGRWRIARLFLAESMVLAIAGAAVGAAIAAWGTSMLSALPPLRVRGIPVSFETHVDGVTVAFSIALGLGCGIIFGLAPALQLARADAQQILRAGATTAPRGRLRLTLMALEVALAVMVLIAAGMFMRNFAATRHEDPGFRRDGVLLAGYDLTGRNVNEASAARFAADVLDRLQRVPGIDAAAIATAVPLDIHGMSMRTFALEGRARPDGARPGSDEALVNTVTRGYFDVMALPILQGRDFSAMRDPSPVLEAIVNETFVRRYLDGAPPLGRWIETRGRRYAITGVVKDSRYNAFGEPPTPIIYFSLRDRPSAAGEIHIHARAGSDASIAADVRRIVRELDPDLPLYDVRGLQDHIESNLVFRRIPARMFAVIGPLLLLLATSGIYAVVAYAVTLRRTEIGVRLALGATARRVVAEIAREHLVVVAAGTLGGWVVAFLFVFGLMGSRSDPAVFAGVPALLLVVAAAASWWPARLAARVDPMQALRQN